ncbi:MAG: STAS domain-containing protein [Clostridia bacterium]|nr:STAS domain-containing protein [Clostridia bacterium]
MQVKNRIYDGTMYIILSGELDEHTANFVRDEIDRLVGAKKVKQVIIDLSELEFMDSTGVGVMIGRYKKFKEKGVPVFISNPSTHAERIFKITGLYDITPKIN